MECKDRKGNIIKNNGGQDGIIHYLYESKSGRAFLKLLTRRFVSDFAGIILNTSLSRLIIPSFVRNNGIDLSEYEDFPYTSYNDFFIRKIKEGRRNFSKVSKEFCSPADSKLSVYQIDGDSRFNIKNTYYTFHELTRSRTLSRAFEGGYLMVFRLSVDDYHRYSYVDSGVKSKNYRINGFYHTVNPIAGDVLPIYQENQREFSILRSDNFGDILMMEVGAMMVGKIVNYHATKRVKRGEEKGRFEFGGSTVILALKKGVVKIDKDILENSKNGFETKVKLGEKIGEI